MAEKRRTQSRGFVNPRVLIWVPAVLIALAISGCKKDQRVEFIQGVWYYKDAHLANIPSESAQVTTWVFDNGYFTMDSCCFYEAHYSGYFYVSDRQENELTLELYNMKGQISDIVLFKDDTLTIVIKINPEADTIKVSGDGPYTRNSP